MKRSINLAKGNKSSKQRFRKINIYAISVFFACVVVSLGLLSYRLILKQTFDGLELKEQQLNTQLLQHVEKKDKLLEIKSRLSEIQKIISKRAPITARMDTLSQIIPTASEVLSVSGSDKEIQISLESESLESLNTLFEQKINEVTSDKKKGIKRIEMQSFGLNPKSLKYVLMVGIEFI